MGINLPQNAAGKFSSKLQDIADAYGLDTSHAHVSAAADVTICESWLRQHGGCVQIYKPPRISASTRINCGNWHSMRTFFTSLF